MGKSPEEIQNFDFAAVYSLSGLSFQFSWGDGTAEEFVVFAGK